MQRNQSGKPRKAHTENVSTDADVHRCLSGSMHAHEGCQRRCTSGGEGTM